MTLLTDIDRYLRHTGMPETKFGRLAVRDPCSVTRVSGVSDKRT